MDQRRNGTRMIIAGVVVVVLVLIVGLFFFMRGGGSSANKSPATKPVVVASQAIPAGTTFRAGQPLKSFFTVRQMPTSLVPFGAYSSTAQIEKVAKSAGGCQPAGDPNCQGQITVTQTIYQNLPVVSGMFSTLGQYRVAAGPAFAIPYGYVGISVTLADQNSVLGSIRPGDTVDLIASYTGQARGLGISAPPQTQYVMNNVKVISVGGPPASPSSGPPATTAGSGALLILARYQQALVIQHLKDFGWDISAVLRSARETNIPNFKTLPVTDKWFFAKTSDPFKYNPGY